METLCKKNFPCQRRNVTKSTFESVPRVLATLETAPCLSFRETTGLSAFAWNIGRAQGKRGFCVAQGETVRKNRRHLRG